MKELLERVSYRNNTLTLWDDGCVTQIRPWGRDGLRVTITPEGGKKPRTGRWIFPWKLMVFTAKREIR